MAKVITITINPDATVKTTVEGCTGPECKRLTKPIEDAIGGEVVRDTPTAEMYEQARAEAHVGRGGKP